MFSEVLFLIMLSDIEPVKLIYLKEDDSPINNSDILKDSNFSWKQQVLEG